MTIKLFVNEEQLKLDQFDEIYISNILKAISSSLGCSKGKDIFMHINGKKMSITAETSYVPIKSDKVKLLIKCTIHGLLSAIEGIAFLDTVDISLKFD